MTSRIPSLMLEPHVAALEPARGTLGQCTQAERGPVGMLAGDAVLWQMDDTIATHQRLAGPKRLGTHFGSEWAKGQAKKTVEKLKKAGLKETNCVELVMWAIERYYAALAEISGPQPAFLTSPAMAPDCNPDALLRTGQNAIARGRDARSFGKKKVDSARGTTLLAALREDGWRTVYFAPERASKDAKTTEKNMYGPALAGKRRFVAGADSGRPVDVTVGMDKVIRGFSAKNPSAEMKQLAAVRFGVGFFDWGMHTFVVGRGSLYEVHWDKGPRNDNVFEKGDFLKQIEGWESGVVAIPNEGWPFSGGAASQDPPPAPVQESSVRPRSRPKTWVAFVVEYPDKTLASGLDYVLEDPEGNQTAGTLGGDGTVERKNIDEGNYKLLLKEVESAGWTRLKARCDEAVKLVAKTSGYGYGAKAKVNIYREFRETSDAVIASLDAKVEDDRIQVDWKYDYASSAERKAETGRARFIAEVQLDSGKRWAKTLKALELELKSIESVKWGAQRLEAKGSTQLDIETLGYADGAEVKLELWRFQWGAEPKKAGDLKPARLSGGKASAQVAVAEPGEYFVVAAIDDDVKRSARSGLLWVVQSEPQEAAV